MGIITEQAAQCRQPSWQAFFCQEEQKSYFQALEQRVTAAYTQSGKTVFPPQQQLFAAFHTPADRVRCIILGQDPYHANKGEAMGLAFSVPDGIKCPPSLRNILAEAEHDTGISFAEGHTDLTPWAEQGVLLLNTSLSVFQKEPMSHSRYGWSEFVKNALIYVCDTTEVPFAVLLWGKPAEKFFPVFEKRKDLLILKSAHPSPLSAYRGFFGSRPFSKTNDFLRQNGLPEIDWSL